MKLNILFIALLCSQIGFAQTNSVTGKISLPKLRTSFFQQGTIYQSKQAKSEEKKRIDERNEPDKNIYISLHPLDFKPELPNHDAQITQRAKTFSPNVVAVTKGSTVYFLNEDELYHNIYSNTRKGRFNIGRRPPGNVYGQKINNVGVIRLGCDVHDEMSAVVLSFDTPYFTKIQADGTYEIKDLPNGQYELRVYHPAFPRHKEVVSLNGEVLVKNITIDKKA